ncbi:hypothetical protein CEXT_570161 [Caerostris extrusa]|uniref:Uncharacterized protein n=1 Tax=Caerostris extrusa TaxID=172846 RepID=A0AAV4RTG9_CAEEX|nr:hypothetical protein CEXT_570161 [Caerostris extrusa]
MEAIRRPLRNEQPFPFTKRPTITIPWLDYPNGNGSVRSLCSFAESSTNHLPGEDLLLRDRSSANFLPRQLWTYSSKAFSEERHMDLILRTGSAVKRNNLRRLRLQLEATSSWGGSHKCVADCLGAIYHLMNGNGSEKSGSFNQGKMNFFSVNNLMDERIMFLEKCFCFQWKNFKLID